MPVFKCKMCGGDLQLNENVSVGECSYCGTRQTLPRLDDDKRANLYDRANHFRRNGEYDKAAALYEAILNEDKTDAEAYWSLVLCKYGIEYVEDPRSHKRIPTCNRTQFTFIFADEDYKQAIANADYSAKAVYEAEAKMIDEIQKGILDISAKEEPFDVFICYKESDPNGRRTPDSVLAQDLYFQLKQEGFKVFFSRITLEDKLGTAYEPYIFAALNSSKVMVVIGTKPENFNSPWVKNEWSRYLALVKSGASKILIPAYKDMDPYHLPEEFSHLQSQDMSKLGFMQDLIRGVKKLISAVSERTSHGTNTTIYSTGHTDSLLERALLCIEDGEFAKADELLENVLNQSPKDSRAYIAKLLVELKLTSEESLVVNKTPLTNYNNYNKAIRFADSKNKEIYESYNIAILERLEAERIRADKLLEADRIKTQKVLEGEQIRDEKYQTEMRRLDELKRNEENQRVEEAKIAENRKAVQKKAFKIAGVIALLVIVCIIVIIGVKMPTDVLSNINKPTSLYEQKVTNMIQAAEKVEVPKFSEIGTYLEITTNAMWLERFTFTAEEVFDAKVPVGVIISQSVEPGTMIAKGSSIKFTVSKGKEMIDLPAAVIGMEYEAANTLLTGLGFVTEKREETNDGTQTANTVIAASPAVSQTYEKGTKVTLRVWAKE